MRTIFQPNYCMSSTKPSRLSAARATKTMASQSPNTHSIATPPQPQESGIVFSKPRKRRKNDKTSTKRTNCLGTDKVSDARSSIAYGQAGYRQSSIILNNVFSAVNQHTVQQLINCSHLVYIHDDIKCPSNCPCIDACPNMLHRLHLIEFMQVWGLNAYRATVTVDNSNTKRHQHLKETSSNSSQHFDTTTLRNGIMSTITSTEEILYKGEKEQRKKVDSERLKAFTNQMQGPDFDDVDGIIAHVYIITVQSRIYRSLAKQLMEFMHLCNEWGSLNCDDECICFSRCPNHDLVRMTKHLSIVGLMMLSDLETSLSEARRIYELDVQAKQREIIEYELINTTQ